MPWHVLVADDNPVNLRLVTGILEARGHRVVTVENGRLARDAAAVSRFDVILMDLDMPEMDGLEATTAIRERERSSSHRATIIALTARSLPGAREACMAAGMDGFLGKPVTPEALLPLMEELVPPSSGVNRQQILNRIDGDEELLAELAMIFQTETPRMLDALRSAVDADDAAGVQRVAHTLRGSLAIFGAEAALTAATALEDSARAGDLREARGHLGSLERALKKLSDDLSAFTKGEAP